MKKVSAVIPAAGSGTRLGVEKQFKIIESHPLWFHTIKPFISSRIIHEIIVVVQQKSIKSIEKILNSISVGKNIKAEKNVERKEKKPNKNEQKEIIL